MRTKPSIRRAFPRAAYIVGAILLLAVGVWHGCLVADDSHKPSLGWGLAPWVPVPERMRGEEIATIFSGVQSLGQAEQSAQLDKIEATHKDDRDVLIIASYVRALVSWRRVPKPEDVARSKQAATRLLELARQNPDQYGYFEKCAQHLLARCEMMEPPQSLENAKTRLDGLLADDANTNAVEFSIGTVLTIVEQQEGRPACFPFLQQLVAAHPATLTAFWCWGFSASLHATDHDWAAAEADTEQGGRVGEQMKDPRLVAASEAALRNLQKRAASAEKEDRRP